MCGIAVCIRQTGCQCEEISPHSPIWAQWIASNAARGPDSQSREDVVITTDSQITTSVSLSFIAATLHLRGSRVVPQPHSFEGNVFCWNGEVFEGLEIPDNANDGEILFSALNALSDPADICSYMATIEGPYAFVFYHRKTQRLMFGRDPLGRRSLLIHIPTVINPYLLISSTSAGKGGYTFQEVDPGHIYSLCMDLFPLLVKGMVVFQDVLIKHNRFSVSAPSHFGTLASVNKVVSDEIPLLTWDESLPTKLDSVVDRFLDVLEESSRIRIENVPPPMISGAARIAVLFSGGIDCTMVAFLANRHVPPGEPIDLLNVSFENPRKSQSCQIGQKSKRTGKQSKQSVSLPFKETCDDRIYNVPDRLSGLEELQELRQLCPNRQWNFVEININYAESSQAKDIIADIMFPSRTVMDLSLAMALYFAARGAGKIREDSTGETRPYTSTARVLLNGLGSDELLGGYGRHRSAFNTSGWCGLIDELQLDLDRLPSRNLGRDDRIISSHGKETRHPFLSLTVVDFLSNLPIHLKVDLRLRAGWGDKMLLRLAARKVGLELASHRKKRAMQFGTHSARMDIGVADTDGDKLL